MPVKDEFDNAMEQMITAIKLRDYLGGNHGITVDSDDEKRDFLSACTASLITWRGYAKALDFNPIADKMYFVLCDGCLLYGSQNWDNAKDYVLVPWHWVKQNIVLPPIFVY